MIEKSKAIKNGVKILDNSTKNEFFENLKSNFPQTIKDGKADLKAISLLLGLNNKADVSGYELTWTGKGLSNAMYSFPCNKELRLDEIYSNVIANNEIKKDCHCEANAEAIQKNKSVDCHANARNDEKNIATTNFAMTKMTNSNNPKNIIIRGDNLDALKILKSAYTEKIKMIYIDPPYNTANDNFIYPDNFREDYKAILREVGLIEIDENGEETESENLRFFKNIQSSRTHSGWLSFMLPRLKLARDLLKEDGVIFISIDDNEQANLKILCDEIFGEDNFVGDFIKQSKVGGGSDSKFIVKEHEYCLVYAKNINLTNEMFLKHDDDYLKRYKEIDDKGRFFWDTFSRRGLTNPIIYDIEAPDGTLIKDGWIRAEETFKKNYQDGEVRIIKIKDKWSVQFKQYLNLNGKKPRSMTTDFGGSIDGKNDIINLFNSDKIFSYPKSVKFISTLLKISTNPNDIILDFFAGSGTTAQAVMELNEEDGGNRQFILVQIDEEIKEEKSKSAYDFCKNELKSDKPVISDITIERVKRAANKIIQSKEKDCHADTGFKVFTLSDKPEIITNEEKSLELISQRTLNNMDIIINMALTNGKTLDKKIETIFDGKLYKCEDAFYLIECDKEILKFLSETQNEYILIDAYGDMELEDFLNLGAGFKERLRVVY